MTEGCGTAIEQLPADGKLNGMYGGWMGWLAGIGLVLLLPSLVLRRREQVDITIAATDLTRSATLCFILVACLVRFGILFTLVRQGAVIYDPDEQFRYITAHRWMQAPTFFNVWNGIWLPGGATYYGLWMRLLPDPFLGFIGGLLVGHVLNIFAVAALAATVAGRRWCGALAGLLIAPAYLFSWYGLGPLVEVNMATAGLVACLFAWRCAAAPAGQLPRWGDVLGLALGLIICALIHLQGWFFLLVLGLAGVPLALRRGWLRSGRGRAQCAVLALSLVAVPLAWCLASWHTLGAPFAFLHNIALNMAEERPKWKLAMTPAVLLIYPRMVWQQLGLLLPLAVAGWIGAGRTLRVRALAPAAVGLATLALIDLSGFRSQFIVPVNHRFVILPMELVLVAIAALTAGLEWRGAAARRARIARWALGLGLALMLMPWATLNLQRGLAYTQATWLTSWRNDIYVVGNWLRRERDNPQRLPGLARGTMIGVYSRYNAPEWAYLLMYMEGGFERVYPVPLERLQNGALKADGYEVLVSEEGGTPPGFEPVAQIVGWNIFRRQH
jgi:hypothetical protein